MYAFEMPEMIPHEGIDIIGVNKQRLEAARQSALPVAEDSREKVKWEIWRQGKAHPLKPNEEFDESREYRIECEMREEEEGTHPKFRKVLVLVE